MVAINLILHVDLMFSSYIFSNTSRFPSSYSTMKVQTIAPSSYKVSLCNDRERRPVNGNVASSDIFKATPAIKDSRRTSKDVSYTLVLEKDSTVDTESLTCSVETGSGVSSLTLPSLTFTSDNREYLRAALHRAKNQAPLTENLESLPSPVKEVTGRKISRMPYEMDIIRTENARLNAKHAPRKQRRTGLASSEDIVSSIVLAKSAHSRQVSSCIPRKPSLDATLRALNQEHDRCRQKLKYLKEEASRSDELNIYRGTYGHDTASAPEQCRMNTSDQILGQDATTNAYEVRRTVMFRGFRAISTHIRRHQKQCLV